MESEKNLVAALRILSRLREEGHQAYLAGGCVRDLLLSRQPHDYDVATSATPDVVLAMFPRTFAVGAHFGVVLVADEDACAGDEASAPPQVVLTEVATFRADGVYSDGRHPDAVRYTLSAEEDVRRRDFTINGLLLDPFSSPLRGSGDSEGGLSQGSAALHPGLFSCVPSGALVQSSLGALDPASSASPGALGEAALPAVDGDCLRAAVLDHVGGLADLEAGVVRAIGRPEARFEEDHLRMLRAVRFAARFGFTLDPATEQAIRVLAPRIAAVSRERVRDELTKMLTEGHARRAFELLLSTGLLGQVLPEAVKMVGVEQPPQFHPEGDVWQHVLLALNQLEPGCSMTLGWGTVLHDIGKPATFKRAADRIRFDGHVEVGVAIAAEICRRFRFSNDESRQTLALIENHMRFMDVQRMKDSTLKRIFRLERFEEHLALHRMDCLASKGDLENWEYAGRRWREMPAEAVRPRPLITGRELIAAGYKPGPGFKTMLEAVEEAQLEGAITTADEAMRLVRERFGGPTPK
jgi:poly(A) polymerase